MSGIFGLFDRTGRVDLAAVENNTKSFHLPGSAPHKIECTRRGRSLIGRYHLDVFRQPPIAPLESTGSVIITSGYRVGGFPAPVDPHYRSSGFDRQILQYVDQTVRGGTYDTFAQFDGAWQILHYDRDGSSLTIIVDRLGLQPLYYFDGPACFAFAPDFSLLLILIGHTPVLDREPLAELFEIGFVTGDRTLFAGVRVFPPGSMARYANGSLSFARFWYPVFSEGDRPFDVAETAAALDAALREAVRQRLELHPQSAVSLSGGMDSRLLLAAAAKEKTPIPAYTFGPEDSIDHTIAPKVAQRLNIKHWRFFDTPQLMAKVCEIGVRKTGGLNNILDFGGMPHLPEIARQARVVINGYGGNELLGFLAFDLLRFALPCSRNYISSWLAAKFNPGWPASELQAIYRSLVGHTPRLGRRLFDLLGKYPAQSPIPLVYHFLFEERLRRTNLLGVMADSLHMEPMVPFCGNNVVDLALSIPPREKLLARFYRRRLLRPHYPDISSIAYSRTGLPADASVLRIAGEKLRHRSDRDPDAPWDIWFRGGLREYLGDYLLAGRPEIHDLIDARLVKTTVTDFLSNRNRPTRVVGQLLSCELFLRIFFKGRISRGRT